MYWVNLSVIVQCFSLTTNQRTVLFSLAFQRSEKRVVASGGHLGHMNTLLIAGSKRQVDVPSGSQGRVGANLR
jgi:hypothetical protein